MPYYHGRDHGVYAANHELTRPTRSRSRIRNDDGQIRENALVLTLSSPDQIIEDFDTDESPFMAALVREMESSAQSIQQIFEGSPPTEAPISAAAEAANRCRG